MADTSKPVPAVNPEHSSENAFEQIHKANQAMRVLIVLALIIMTVMLAFGIARLNSIYQTEQQQLSEQQAEINNRAEVNKQLLDELTDNSRDTQYLICRIVTVQITGREIPDEITKICGPVLEQGASQSAGEDAGPESRDDQSFLDQGSNEAAALNSQPAPSSDRAATQNNTNQDPTQMPDNQAAEPNSTPPTQPENQNPQQPTPGLVDTLQDTVDGVLCVPQNLLQQACTIRLGG